MNLLHSRTRLNGRVTISLVASYVVDWIVVIVAAVIGAILSNIDPNKRPFSLTNAEISFPYVVHEKISTTVLAILAVIVPAAAILIVCLILVPGPTVSKSTPKGLIWRRKLWEWHTGWLGLALSLAAAFFITNGMKNLFGKPRPDLLSRCMPDRANLSSYTLVPFPDVDSTSVVSAAICKQTDSSILNDGFRSFPSGHSSFSAAGLVYLSLFLASKLAISIPFLAPSLYSRDESRHAAFYSPPESHELRDFSTTSNTKPQISGNDQFRGASGHDDTLIAARNQAAAPPLYLLVLAVIPFFLSIYISSTRYSDFRHHGFDILFGYFIGTVTAVLAFRLYHLPISQGAGWSWGPRSKDRSFWAGIGVGSYAGTNANRVTEGSRTEDLEAGTVRSNEVGDASNGAAAVQRV